MILGFRLRVTMPSRFTASGSGGVAILTRFCTSTVAKFTSVPTSNVTFMPLCPLLVLLLDMYDMPGDPLICVSIAVVVVCSTVCASAPVNVPVTFTVGGVMSGYCAIGSVVIAMRPTSTITTDVTIAVTGLFINTSAIMSRQD